MKKQKIPSTVRNTVWNNYIGTKKGLGMCFCCKKEHITKGNFQCGHVISEKDGGKCTIENLRPICGLCNTSMGTTNMNDFIEKHGFHQNIPLSEIPPVKHKKKVKYKYITLNPDNKKCKIQDMKNIIKDIEERFKKIYAYVYEQRGEIIEDIGKYMHMHILLESNMTIPKMKEILNTLLNKYKLFKTVDQIYVTSVNGDIRQIIKKMQGYKTPEKIKQIIITDEWRKLNKLHNIYTKEDIPYEQPTVKIIKKIMCECEIIEINGQKYALISINNKLTHVLLD